MAAHPSPSFLPSERTTQAQPPQQPVGPQPRTSGTGAKLSRRLRWFVIFIDILAFALIAFAILVAAFWPFTESKIKAAIEEEWPGEVQIGSFRSLVFPHPGCVVRDLKLSLRSDSKSIQIVTVAEGKLVSRYADFILRPHFIAQVALRGLHVELPEQSKWRNLRSTPSQEKSKPNRYGEIIADNSSLTIARSQDGPLVFAVHHFKLNGFHSGSAFGFETAFLNPLPQGEIEAAGKFGPWNSSNMGKSPFSGGYTFRNANLGDFDGIAGILSSTGHFSGALRAIDVVGKTEVPNFEVVRSRHAVPLRTEFAALVDGKNGDVLLRQVNANFLDTEVVAKGTIARPKGKHGKYASLDFQIARGRIDDVLRLFVKAPQPPMRGAGKFSAHVNIPPGPQPFLHRVELNADFIVYDAHFTNPERQKSLDDLSWRARGKKANKKGQDNNKETNKNDRDADPENIGMELQSHLHLVNAVANFSGIEATVPGAVARLAGNFHIESEKVDLHGDLRTEASLSKETSGIKSILLKPLDPFFEKKKAGADVPVGITGTYSDPHFGIELPSKKPPSGPPPANSKD